MPSKSKRRAEFLKKLRSKYQDHDNPENIYPASMTDAEFVQLITDYFLGEFYYIGDPVSHGQANVIVAYEIISKN